jgi:hypothetical protein
MSLLLLFNSAAATPASVNYLWTGVPSSSGVIVTAKLNTTGTANSARLVVSTSSDLSSPLYSTVVAPDDTYRIAKFSIANLTANTQYYYGVEVDGTVDTTTTGQFKTIPSGATSFRFSAGCCMADGSTTTAAIDAIMALSNKPLFHVLHGDMHYGDVLNNHPNPTEADFQAEWTRVFSEGTKGQFFRNIPQVYTPDDHDFLYNNTGGYASVGVKMTGRDNAVNVLRRNIPEPLASSTALDAMYYSFVVGRMRFIVTDDRSDRVDVTQATRSIMSTTQMEWIKNEITAAATAGQAVCLIVSSIWSALSTTADTWGAYAAERTEINNHVATAGMTGKTFIIAGDGHQMAIQSVGADFSTGQNCPIPCFQAAPLFANTAGGLSSSSYTSGPYPAGGITNVALYGLVDVNDDGNTMTVTFSGYTPDGTQVMSETITPIAGVGGGAGAAATGGTVTEPGDGYRYHTFTTSSTLTVTAGGSVDYLVVAGGGGGTGATSTSPGAGAGGVVTGTTNISSGSYTITIGNGGLGDDGTANAPGSNSSIGSLVTATGGAKARSGVNVAQSGGSGAGGGANTTSAVVGGSGIAGQGNSGGAGFTGATSAIIAAGGGGGAGGAGQNASSGKGGDGGPGITIWGRSVGGGGGGTSGGAGTYQGVATHGGGNAAKGANGTAGTVNTGGGGGSAQGSGTLGGSGGSGIVVIRYALAATPTNRIYKGSKSRSQIYLGSKSDAQIYKGTTALF